ncbi:MAG: nucleotidyltransferase domain-containing protein [Bdellovibrionales bacterium]|nr:nucleotidyltransferase domain-containing protein [Bdellovibrionales bacterium]
MKFGLSDEHWKLVLDLAINPLKSKGAQVWVFGSRARGDHVRFSDLDILFAAEDGESFTLGEIGSIKEALEESDLPVRVDLVDDRVLAKDYREGVERDRIEI